MPASVRFYRDLLGMEVIYGDENGYFSSLRTKDGKDPILNLEHGNPATKWGRLIFHVSDVDGFWAYFKENGLIRRVHEMPHGANGISICPIQTVMSCRLRVRFSSLPMAA
jgi:catechol 2,3-dioxygenase-like lactoylglutathione lyase family enzyme